MSKFYFDFRDVFKTPRLALSGKKIFLQFIGFFSGYILWLIFNYVAFLSEGMQLGEIWEAYGLFPMFELTYNFWYSKLLFFFGFFLFLVFWFFGSTAVGKVTCEQLKGDEFYSTKDALRFSRKHFKTALFSFLFLIVAVLFLFICGIVIGLLGKIPVVGELGLGIFYLIPIFVVALFTIYTLFIFFISLLLAPAVVATTKEDTFETLIQLFTSIWAQPWRYFLYTGITAGLAKIATFVFAYFSFRAVQFIHLSLGIFMKDKLANIFDQALNYLALPTGVINFFTNLFPKINFAFFLPEAGLGDGTNWSGSISAFLIGISFILIFFFILSYGLAILSCGQTVTYLIIRKRKDEENLLEKKTELEELEELEEKKEKEKPEETKEEEKKGE
jgi:hypothetical protein